MMGKAHLSHVFHSRGNGHPAGAETPRAESLRTPRRGGDPTGGVVHYDTTVDSVVSGSTVVDIRVRGIMGPSPVGRPTPPRTGR
jgi:hypothetical protein